jgi:putative oxidoreductase
MNIALWIVQLLLAALFGFAGTLKATTPIPQLAHSITWAPDMPEALVRFIGLSELAGALGLLLPAATRIAPWLTSLAAGGLTLVMLFATVFHLARGEMQNVPITVILGLLAAFVSWGRARKVPIAAR